MPERTQASYFRLSRSYDPPSAEDGYRVPVDRVGDLGSVAPPDKIERLLRR